MDRWGPAQPLSLPLGASLELGRSGACGISHETVSRRHALLRCRCDSLGATVAEVQAVKRVWVQLPGRALVAADPDPLGRCIKVGCTILGCQPKLRNVHVAAAEGARCLCSLPHCCVTYPP